MKTNQAHDRSAVRIVAASVLLVVLFSAGTSAAAAQSDSSSPPPSSPSCDPASSANLTAVLTADGRATFTVENALPLCDPVPIGVALYTKAADGFVVPQLLSDSSTDTIRSGSKTLKVTMPDFGLGPDCFFQLDAFTGDVLPEITDTERYNERLLAYDWGQFSTCIAGESTSTSSSTTTTAAVSATSEPPTVLGVAITRPGAAPLARTGPAFDVAPLVAASGWLLLLGGTLIAFAYRTPRRAR